MTIQQVIEKAIEGGWKKNEKPFFNKNNDGYFVTLWAGDNTGVLWLSDILLDPEFWKALGKSMGWEDVCESCQEPLNEEVVSESKSCPNCGWGFATEAWQVYWHRFIDHLTEGNSIESYFETL